ncbi:NAD(P)-binding protein [Aspergillus sclerotioniger CBS 115572]|uniref:NAD(P)-binding protein n=1 Tax=Aspergillus sclerotioniger CBS 115572 TaxID=1450535 RepID=A0A317VMX4_9EURO|nr:NAD(P)-binding protein [Aspergillus sclerotioniger CBS 115572]PWY75275.1 NAD(P)-binding protein [Aspergillus sclerotioniger CBS 115572]
MPATTMKQWTITYPDKNISGMRMSKVPLPKTGPHEVLPIVPVSDGAGVVIEVGSNVREFKQGDKVMTIFNQGHQYGDITPYAASTGVGGTIDGVLRQYGVYNESGLVKAPRNLTTLESSTLPGAALTAWNALYGLKPIRQWVIVQGTGGVGVFGLQLAKAAGATVIATTSSEEKASRLKELKADHVIDYRDQPNWGGVARQLSPNQAGVDYALDIGGTDTLEQSLECIEMEGIINLIGFLGAGDKPQPGILDALNYVCTVRGLFVGSRAMLVDTVQAFEGNNIRPMIDGRIFGFEEGKEAFEYLAARKHFGKVVVRVD